MLILASAARVVVEDLACRESGGSLVCTLGGRGVVVPRMMILLGDVGLLPGKELIILVVIVVLRRGVKPREVIWRGRLQSRLSVFGKGRVSRNVIVREVLTVVMETGLSGHVRLRGLVRHRL